MRRQLSVTAAAVVGTIVLIHCTFLVSGGAEAAPVLVSHAAVQQQRLRRFAAYAERVGAALELLTSGPDAGVSDAEGGGDEVSGKWTSRSTDTVAPAATSSSPMTRAARTMTSLAFLTQAIQYPHEVMRVVTGAVMRRTEAVRTLAAVVMGSPLHSKAEAALARVQGGQHYAHPLSFSPPSRAISAPFSAAMQRSTEARLAAISSPTPPSLTETPVSPDTAHHDVVALAGSSSNGNGLPSCVGGRWAISSDSLVFCTNYARQYSAGEYAALSPSDQRSCAATVYPWQQPHFQTCICPRDSFLMTTRSPLGACVTRPLDVQVLLNAEHLCFSEADAALGLPGSTDSEYCFRTARNSVLQFPVVWRYAALSDDALLALSAETNLQPRVEQPNSDPALQWVALSPAVAAGTYTELSINRSLFDFSVAGYAGEGRPPPSPNDLGFYRSRSSQLRNGSAFTAAFSFAAPRKTQQQMRETPFSVSTNIDTYLGNANGTSTHTVTINLSAIPDDFLEGDQLYMETGLKGGSTMYSYRVAHLHISFTDVAPPPANSFKYRKQFNPLYILLIAAVCTVVVATGLAVLWYRCMRPEDADDSLVAAVQRKRHS